MTFQEMINALKADAEYLRDKDVCDAEEIKNLPGSWTVIWSVSETCKNILFYYEILTFFIRVIIIVE